jgi:hypothetical protein
MDTPPEHDPIAARAFELWEQHGRPEGRDAEFWTRAEFESRRPASVPRPEGDTPKSDNPPAEPAPRGPSAFPAPARRRPPHISRHRGSRRTNELKPVTDHYIVVVDRFHLRIYRVMGARGTAQFELAEAFDLTALGVQEAGGTAVGAPSRLADPPGMDPAALGERAPPERTLVSAIAEQVDRFFLEHDEATWDFAAAQPVHQPVLNRLTLPTRRRLGRTVVKEITQQTPQQLRSHFVLVGLANA